MSIIATFSCAIQAFQYCECFQARATLGDVVLWELEERDTRYSSIQDRSWYRIFITPHPSTVGDLLWSEISSGVENSAGFYHWSERPRRSNRGGSLMQRMLSCEQLRKTDFAACLGLARLLPRNTATQPLNARKRWMISAKAIIRINGEKKGEMNTDLQRGHLSFEVTPIDWSIAPYENLYILWTTT